MHRLTSALTVSALLLSAAPLVAQDTPALESVDSRVSYGLGLQIGENLAQNDELDFDLDAFVQGIADVEAGADPRLDQETIVAAFEALNARASEAKLSENTEFLEENGARDGVTTTDSGLQYQVVEEGTGETPAETDTVTVHYEGRLLDETVFDSSIERGEPASFPVNGVIQGWQEALQLMKPGAKWEVWIPSELAYGPQGAGQAIGPNEVLNFTIELISIDS
ncbi:FKBP-type peptidyl-prolyl cis-trans isomerase [Tateyamaria sp. ANG-S1]|uniref:FKBP-type peptidyl-prolyl cis-trans isomerase n=1 Tax=Tateyamaria sp. ANG-S1 TaxID=1577905 RepID=UPI0009E2BE1F|nr:FKBP-type peptidyl-prolyl cis-trans isomerase [Tateyamaria sp. ANG-S1]